MKKMIFVLFVILTSVSVNAQIKYSKPKDSVYTIIKYTTITHFHYTDGYELGLLNVYKNGKMIKISLGKGKEEAIESMANLITMFNDGEDNQRIEVEDIYGHSFDLVIKKNNISNCFWTVNNSIKYKIDIDDLNCYLEVLKQYSPKTIN